VEIVEEIGNGAFGVVLKGFLLIKQSNALIKNPVAIKVSKIYIITKK